VKLSPPLSERERQLLAFTPEAVAEAVRSRRIAEGLSTYGLAVRLRVDSRTVRNYELARLSPVTARMLSYAYDGEDTVELWRARAMLAERALRQVTEAVATYRGGVRLELAEREHRAANGNGRWPDSNGAS
jgi:transcriptional regulator with XRE-family HTH domain